MNTLPMSALLWFVAVIALIPLALWLLKRTPMGGAARSGVMRSIAMLPLSHSQRIVTIEVGQGAERRWLVLGVTPQSITNLHTLVPATDTTADVPAATPTASPSAFAMLLSRFGARRDAKDVNAR
jgi:flagellar protein FliO/FliZ